ncbi:2Fe-2S iron-sulfur cluster-binding protein [Derxia lacustris]|uniref:2Fe-2S iron-sulfur cluster-binding protein n=1 Tax=Derxia lacustris TaxID=764842 RepID=UPI000A172E8A|nr:2Fe-2S iron-sulfur cluster-binding protein [Derxia lacustris]
MHNSGQHRITIANTGESYDCRSDETLLLALARVGKRGIPLGCRGGGCGICKVEVVSGDYSTCAMSASQVDSAERQQRRALACCVFPAGALVVKVIGRLEKNICRPLPGQG